MKHRTVKFIDQSEIDLYKSIIHRLKHETKLKNEGALILTALEYYNDHLENKI